MSNSIQSLALLLTVLLASAPGRAWAGHPDFAAGAVVRSVPFGMAAIGEAGWNVLLWGIREKPGDFRYGYVRVSARYAGSVAVNRADATLTLSPMAPLAFDLGFTTRLRLIEHFATVDCDGVQCGGRLAGSFARTRVLLGVGPFFGLAAITLEQLVPKEPDGPFVDEQSALAGGDGPGGRRGDVRREQVGMLGLRAGSRWSAGYLYQGSQMLGSGSSNRQDMVFVNFLYRPEWSLMGGAGFYESSTYARGVTVFARVRWSGPGSLELN